LRIKKTLSIQDEVMKKAQKKADEMFSGNFSIYITYLINNDCKKEYLYEDNAKKTEEVKKCNSKVMNAISDILGD
jgi:hypothetical protein